MNKKNECNQINMSNKLPHMVSIIKYITEHFQEDITCESVARHFFMSRAKLNRDFHEYTNSHFHRFLDELRINKSKFMLKQGYSISEIASSVGFENSSYFCQFFKKIEGVTPLQYSKKYHYPRNIKKR